jgi:hypothetical protein
VICLLNKDAITWKESLLDKGCDLLLQHPGEETTSNQETKLGVFLVMVQCNLVVGWAPIFSGGIEGGWLKEWASHMPTKV